METPNAEEDARALDEQPHEIALRWADAMRSLPRERQERELLRRFRLATTIRNAVKRGMRAFKNRRGTDDLPYETKRRQFNDALFDPAMFAVLDITGNRTMDQLSEREIDCVLRGARAGLEAFNETCAREVGGGDREPDFHVLRVAMIVARASSAAAATAFVLDEYITGEIMVAAMCDRGKQNAVPRVVALAAAELGWLNADIHRLLQRAKPDGFKDRAQVRRLVRDARVS